MTRPLAVVRPEPGNTATAQRIAAAGMIAVRLPLFATRPLAWDVPDARDFDALLLTSANAVRLGGEGLRRLASLPLYAVGAATAAAARAAGLAPAHVGDGDGQALVATARASGVRRALSLAGRERTIATGGIVARVIAVYASDPLAIDRAALDELDGAVILLHSARAAARFADLIGSRRRHVRVAAISPAAAAAAGSGWADCAVAAAPTDAALIRAAATLAD